MFCDKFLLHFCLSLLTIIWHDVHGREGNVVQMVVDAVRWGTPEGEATTGRHKTVTRDEKERHADSMNTMETPTWDRDAASQGEETPSQNIPTEAKSNHKNNIDTIVNEYYTNVLIPSECNARAKMEEEKKKMSFITKIKNLFIQKEKTKEDNPATLTEYIFQKNKQIWDLEQESASTHTIKNIYKHLFWATAYVLLNVVIIPFISYFYLYKRCKDTIMHEYKNNTDRRIVPYDYDFSAKRPRINISGRTFRNCKYHGPHKGSNFCFLFGMLHGAPYAIVKL
ncbi:hypothetical protein AK88_04815 [Plasmodium fragile]|uniref:Plasmodium falciparum erythrocyte membrane protein 1 acidic terminal segment domain-containing protein n=1 Tax=Plasmodium fragile TaxID=5857 RepID=A0A0D9QEX0_PLAFR|nr:uncharacterized protein AK88_04815 [Plasmodium fragile]KJP85549.1 hypothetical protein AK88_04815 [Plasmodium fragile]